MRINVGLPSRGRPLDMIASALSLFRLASGANEISVMVATDEDDYILGGVNETNRAAAMLKSSRDVTIVQTPRALGLGELHNAMARRAPPDAAFMLWSDRVLAITPEWDHNLAMGCMQCPNRVIWLDSVHLTGAGQFVLPPAWRAAQGDPCPGLYPFWFEDTAVEELDAFVHGFPRMSLAAKCAGTRGAKTTRCRDIAFWVSVFAATRPQRLAQAAEIGRKLGVAPPSNLAGIIANFETRDASFIARAPALQEQFGAEGPADETYLAARARAEEILAQALS